jgi:rhamnosyltransferase
LEPQLRQLHAPPSPSVSILVRVLNEVAALPEFWKRLRQQTVFAEMEIVFLDIGSTDGTLEYLLEQPCTVYSMIAASKEDFNYGRNCNRVMAFSHAPVVIFLSAHVFLTDPRTIESITELLGQSSRPAALYLRQVPNAIMGFNFYEAAYLARRFPAGSAPQLQSTPAGFSNAASALMRSAWEAHPFPDLHGGEDVAWADKHLAAGGELLYLPQLQVLHSHDWTPQQVYDRVRLVAEARMEIGQYGKSIYYFIGVFVSTLRHGADLREAGRYALAHARAYL